MASSGQIGNLSILSIVIQSGSLVGGFKSARATADWPTCAVAGRCFGRCWFKSKAGIERERGLARSFCILDLLQCKVGNGKLVGLLATNCRHADCRSVISLEYCQDRPRAKFKNKIPTCDLCSTTLAARAILATKCAHRGQLEFILSPSCCHLLDEPV